MQLELLNQRPKYSRPRLAEPPPWGYLHLGAEVEPPTGRVPFARTSDHKTALLERLKELADQVRAEPSVQRATVYRARVIPPPAGYAGRPGARPLRYDVVVLIETTSPDTIDDVRKSEAFQALAEALTNDARQVDEVAARCVKSLGDVDKERPGLFLFNHFVAEDVDVALELWDWLAGWFTVETGLDNSTVLQPLEPAGYAFVNHARWDTTLPLLLLRQLSKPSFRTYVQANLLVNRTGVMPILYRLA
jgi:quinol monooxygenase YgiN